MKEDKVENLTRIIFASVGALLFIIGLIITGNIFHNYTNKVDTVGTITEISSYINTNYDEDDEKYEVYVSYTVEGKEYKSRLNIYSSNFYEGKEIKIYYDKDNPNEIGMKSFDLLFLILPGLGLLLLVIGGTGILKKINNKKLKKRLKENGELIYANYVETVLNASYQVNERSPYNIICEWNNTQDGNKYIFRSENIWINPEYIIEEKNIKQFPVYIDKDDKKKYFIDIDCLTENIVDLR